VKLKSTYADGLIDIINPDVDLMINQIGKLDVAKAIGSGFLTVTYDKGDRIPYSGKIELVTSEIGEDLAYYFVMSEQVPSAVSLGVLVDDEGKVLKAGGFIIQLMPGCDESFIKYLEEKITTLKPITTLLNEGLGCEGILKEIFGEYEFNIYSQKEVKYFCDCSKEKVEKTLIAIGKNDIYSILKEQNYVEVVCHFCNTKYQFRKEDVDKLSF
jgi:molecular chaperone Hsp33